MVYEASKGSSQRICIWHKRQVFFFSFVLKKSCYLEWRHYKCIFRVTFQSYSCSVVSAWGISAV